MKHMSQVCTSSFLLASFAFASTARAEDATTAVYEDAKEVIEDLMVAEAAKSGANLAMCTAPELASFYFSNTITELRKEGPLNTTALGNVARPEAAALAGEWVRVSLASGAKTAWNDVLNGKNIPIEDNVKALVGGVKTACSNADAAENAKNEKAKDDAIQALLNNWKVRPLDACAKDYADATTALSCELGLATQAAVMQNRDAILTHLVGALVVPVTTKVSPPGEFFTTWTSVRDAAMKFAQKNVTPETLNAEVAKFLTGMKAIDPFMKHLEKTVDPEAVYAEVAKVLTGAAPEASLTRLVDKSPDPKKAEEELAKVLALARPIYAAWQSTMLRLRHISEDSLTPSSIQQAIVGSLQSVVDANTLAATNKPYGDIIAAAKIGIEVAQDKTFLTLLESIKSGNGHQIVFDAVSVALKSTSSIQAKHPELKKATLDIVTALLNYASESREGNAPSATTREVARTAVFEFVSENESGGYTTGSSHVGWDWMTFSWGPSFSPGYVNAGHQGFRLPVNVELGVLKVTLKQQRWAYTGIHFSAFNLLGYPAEVTLRDATANYYRPANIFGMMIHPRLDFVFAVPAFSRRLALYSGVGFTPVAATKVGEGYEYRWIGDRPGGTPQGDFVPRYFDLSAGIRYFAF